jgi:hypothetical protein
VTVAEYIAFATLFLLIAGLIFSAGQKEAKNREAQAQFARDLDGIGGKVRGMEQRLSVEHNRMAGCLILETAGRLMDGKDHSELERVVRRLLMD